MRVKLLRSSTGEDLQLQALTTSLVNDCIAIDGGSIGLALLPQEMQAIRDIVVTHAHSDHTASLPIFIAETFTESDAPVVVYALPEVVSALRNFIFNDQIWPNFEKIPLRSGRGPALEFRTITPREPFEINGVSVTAVRVNHVVPTVGLKLQDHQTAAAKAAEKGAAQGARLLVARARLSEAWAFRNLGNARESMSACDEAKRIYAAAGDKGGVARALNDAAQVVWEQGDLPGAVKIYRQVLETSRNIGDKKSMGAALNNIGVVLYHQGNLVGAKPAFLEALAIRREIGDKRAMGATLSNLAGVLRNQMDLAGARQMLEETLQIFREIGDKRGVAGTLDNIGIIQVDLGNLAVAKRGYEESLVISREIGNKRLLAYACHLLGEVHLAEGNLADARKQHEEALRVRTELGEKETVAESRLALAVLSVEEGHFDQGEKLARDAAEEFSREKAIDSEAFARAILARSLLRQGKELDAQGEINRASAVSLKCENLGVRLSVAIETARVRATLKRPGGTASATKILQTTLAQADKAGLVGIQLESRLALGEVEMKASNPAAGRTRMKILEKEARAKGYGLIAQKASLNQT